MSTLYIRHPAKASFDAASTPLPCAFALVVENGKIAREGSAPLANLAQEIAGAQQVVLVLAAADVSLWRVKLPKLARPKLKLALPNLLEEQLLSNPGDCIIEAESQAGSDGLHTVAVVQRAWLESLQQSLRKLGAQKIRALPAQLCSEEAGQVAVVEHKDDLLGSAEVTVCGNNGFGLPLWADQPGQLAQEVARALRSMLPEQPLQLYVQGVPASTYHSVVDEHTTVVQDAWPRWVAGAKHCKLDLMNGVAGGAGGVFEWQRWSWPLMLLVLVLLVHIISLNVEWLRAKREADTLKKSMTQTFSAAFPKEPVQDPIRQAQQKINAAKLAAGQAAPDDFTSLAAAFGEAWQSVSQGKKTATIASLEYKERSLQVKFKEDGEVPLAEMKAALAARHLQLANSDARTWQIKLGK